jgi:hypothetical protein
MVAMRHLFTSVVTAASIGCARTSASGPEPVGVRLPFTAAAAAPCEHERFRGVDSQRGEWRCPNVVVRYDWGAANLVAGDVTPPPGVAVDSTWMETIDGHVVKLVTYGAPVDFAGLVAFWPDGGKAGAGRTVAPAVLRMTAEASSESGLDDALHIVRSVRWIANP